MSSTAQGNGGTRGAWRVTTDRVFDVKTGYQVVELWEGIKSVILALERAWNLSGLRTHVANRGPIWRIEVYFGTDQTAAELPQDNWTWKMEPVQVPIWASPTIWSAMGAWSYGAADFKKKIEDAVSKGLTLSGAIASNTTAVKVWRLLCRGTDSYEVKRPVLRRTRTYSYSYINRQKIDSVQSVYSTAALKTTFGLPSEIQNALPIDPVTAPTDTQWAWMLAADESVIVPSINKIQESRTWVFAAWSTLLYAYVA